MLWRWVRRHIIRYHIKLLLEDQRSSRLELQLALEGGDWDRAHMLSRWLERLAAALAEDHIELASLTPPQRT